MSTRTEIEILASLPSQFRTLLDAYSKSLHDSADRIQHLAAMAEWIISLSEQAEQTQELLRRATEAEEKCKDFEKRLKEFSDSVASAVNGWSGERRNAYSPAHLPHQIVELREKQEAYRKEVTLLQATVEANRKIEENLHLQITTLEQRLCPCKELTDVREPTITSSWWERMRTFVSR